VYFSHISIRYKQSLLFFLSFPDCEFFKPCAKVLVPNVRNKTLTLIEREDDTRS
jgi:hypothetical protein